MTPLRCCAGGYRISGLRRIKFARDDAFSGLRQAASAADSLVFGIMDGYINSSVAFDSPNTFTNPTSFTRFNFSGGTVSMSADYMNGGFFIDALVKADFLSLDIGGIPVNALAAGASGNQTVNSTTWGVLSNVGYRFERGRYFIEPLATVTAATDRIGTLTLPAAGIAANFGNGNAVNIAGGARAGGILMDDHYHYLEASLTTRVWDRLVGDSNVIFTSTTGVPGTTFPLSDKFSGAYGEVELGLDWIDRVSGWSAFVNGDAKFNDNFTTLTGKAGLRYGF